LTIMIELPKCPTVGIVAAPTVRAETAFMIIVLLMAGPARRVGILEFLGDMTLLARCGRMKPDQRKAG